MRYVFLVLFIFSGFAFGQNKTIDSLKKVIETTKVDTVKGQALCRLCVSYVHIGEYDSALKLGNKGLSLSEKADNLRGKMLCLNSLALVHSEIGNYRKAIDYGLMSLNLSETIGEKYNSASCLNIVGNSFSSMGNNPKALEYYQKCLKVSKSINDSIAIAICYNNIANIYANEKKLSRAMEYFQMSLKIYENVGYKLDLAIAYNNIGMVFRDMKKYSDAIRYFNKSMDLEKQSQNNPGISYVLGNIGSTYYYLNDFQSALNYYQKSLQISEQSADSALIAYNYVNVASAYYKIGQLEVAKKYVGKGLKLAQYLHNLNRMHWGASISYQIDSALGDWKSAFYHHQLYKQYSDSLTNESKAQEFGRLESKFEFDKQTEAKEKQLALDAERRTRFYYLFGGIFTFVLAGAGFFYYNYRSKAKNNRILSGKNAEISSQKAELENAYEELNSTLDQVRHQSEIIQHKNLQIEDSIRYAFQIQTAILPEPGYLQTILPAHFIFYQPKDIVSGDFYQAYLINDLLYVIAADCTGHGVPGAFMSVVGTNALYNAINVLGMTDPDAILSELDRSVRRTLKQEKTSESKDGMDLALLIFSEQKQKIFFSGAGRPLYFLRDGNLTEIKGDKFPVGGSQHENKLFTAHEIDISKGDRFYLFTDGITDQFGGESKKKFTPKRLQEFIFNHQSVSMSEQGKLFRQTMTEWMKGHKQLDDLTLIGLEV